MSIIVSRLTLPACMYFITAVISLCTKNGCMIRNRPVKHDQELHAKPKFLVKAEAYLTATFGSKITDFFKIRLHWVSVVRESMDGL